MSCLFNFITKSPAVLRTDKPPRLPTTPVKKVKPTFCIYDSDDSDDNQDNKNRAGLGREFPLLEISPYLLYQDCCLSDTFFVVLDTTAQQGEGMRPAVGRSVSLPYIPRAQSRYPVVRWETVSLVILCPLYTLPSLTIL